MANKITDFKKFVVHDLFESCIGDSKKFLMHFRNERMSHLNVFLNQNFILYEQNLELKKQMNFVESELQVMRDSRLLKEQRALKRKNANFQKMRDSVTES